MKDPSEWDEQTLLSLPLGEFDWLEVKGRRALDLSLPDVKESDVRNNLSKAVSAFANSGGGVLVLGMENPKKVWRVDDDGVNLEAHRPNTREWLEDIIPNLVEFPLTSFNVYAITRASEGSQIAEGRAVFVIDIRDSEAAPHQALDKKYYARVAGKSQPIGHRLVADIFGRRQHPQIDLEFALSSRIVASGYVGTETRRLVEIEIRARNNGRVYAQYVNCFVHIPRILMPEAHRDGRFVEIDGIQYVRCYFENTVRDVVGLGPAASSTYGPSRFDPILPGLAHLWTRELRPDFPDVRDIHRNAVLLWEVHGDNAPKREGRQKIESLPLFPQRVT